MAAKMMVSAVTAHAFVHQVLKGNIVKLWNHAQLLIVLVMVYVVVVNAFVNQGLLVMDVKKWQYVQVLLPILVVDWHAVAMVYVLLVFVTAMKHTRGQDVNCLEMMPSNVTKIATVMDCANMDAAFAPKDTLVLVVKLK